VDREGGRAGGAHLPQRTRARAWLASLAAHGALALASAALIGGLGPRLRPTHSVRVDVRAADAPLRLELQAREPERALVEARAEEWPQLVPPAEQAAEIEPQPAPIAPEPRRALVPVPAWPRSAEGWTRVLGEREGQRASADSEPLVAAAQAVSSASAAMSPGAAAQSPTEPGSVVRGPRLLHAPAPEYPRSSRRRGEEGDVVCRIAVAADGGVESVALERSSGFPLLDSAALRALAAWRFEPAQRDGRPVAGALLHRVVFELR
jgi:protein TonB